MQGLFHIIGKSTLFIKERSILMDTRVAILAIVVEERDKAE